MNIFSKFCKHIKFSATNRVLSFSSTFFVLWSLLNFFLQRLFSAALRASSDPEQCDDFVLPKQEKIFLGRVVKVFLSKIHK